MADKTNKPHWTVFQPKTFKNVMKKKQVVWQGKDHGCVILRDKKGRFTAEKFAVVWYKLLIQKIKGFYTDYRIPFAI